MTMAAGATRPAPAPCPVFQSPASGPSISCSICGPAAGLPPSARLTVHGACWPATTAKPAANAPSLAIPQGARRRQHRSRCRAAPGRTSSMPGPANIPMIRRACAARHRPRRTRQLWHLKRWLRVVRCVQASPSKPDMKPDIKHREAMRAPYPIAKPLPSVGPATSRPGHIDRKRVENRHDQRDHPGRTLVHLP